MTTARLANNWAILGSCRGIRLCDSLGDLCASVVSAFFSNSTTETQRITEFALRNPFPKRLLISGFFILDRQRLSGFLILN